MTLGEFKALILSKEVGYIFNYGITEPFVWRGSYDEVAFNLIDEPTSREVILSRIEMALTQSFVAYKGGEFRYNTFTDVHFERDNSCWSDGRYCAKLISKIENKQRYRTMELRLASLAFL